MIINISGRVKTIGGLVIIVIAILAFIFWEARGREIVTMDEVFVAKEDIKTHEPISNEMFDIVRVPANAKISNAISPPGSAELAGKLAVADIVKGSQLSNSHLVSSKEQKGRPMADYIIANEWIAMRSSALRRGDEINIVSEDGQVDFGKYEVSYVKDDEEKEVTGSEGTLGLSKEKSSRINGSSPIHHIEISCEFSQYMKIRQYASARPAASLLLVSIL